MTITRYSGIDQSPGTTQTIYTVPTGKVAKLVFNSGFINGKANWNTKALDHAYNVGNAAGVNSCGAFNTDNSAQFLIGGRLIFGSHTIGGSKSIYNTNVFFQGDNMFIAHPTESTPSIINYNMKAIDAELDTNISILKNEFILTAGDTVQIFTTDSSNSHAHVSYDFNIYEEEL